MTWTKLDDNFTEDPRLFDFPRGIRHMRVEVLVWCNRHNTDGRIPRSQLHRITDEPHPYDAAAQLVGAGVWEADGDNWRIPDFLIDQPSKEKVDKTRSVDRDRQRRWRAHAAGDHSGCVPPSKCVKSPVSHTGRHGVTNAAPTRPVGEGRDTTGTASRQAVLRSAPDVPPQPPTADEWVADVGAVRIMQAPDNPLDDDHVELVWIIEYSGATLVEATQVADVLTPAIQAVGMAEVARHGCRGRADGECQSSRFDDYGDTAIALSLAVADTQVGTCNAELLDVIKRVAAEGRPPIVSDPEDEFGAGQ